MNVPKTAFQLWRRAVDGEMRFRKLEWPQLSQALDDEWAAMSLAGAARAAADAAGDTSADAAGQPSGAEEEAPKGAAAAATPAGLNAKARRKLKRAQEKE